MLANAAQGLRGLLMREWLLLLGILLFSFYIRVIQIDTAFFGPEQAWIAHASWKLANLQEFPTHMFNTSAGFSQLPLTVYITFIPYLISDSVYSLLIYFIILSLVAVGLCWWFVRRYWGWQVAAIATIVYACMPWAIIFSLRIWANTLLPPFVMIWAIACGLAFAEKRHRWLMVAWGLACFSIQLAASGGLLLAITFILTCWIPMSRSWRYALIGSALALLPTVPWIYAQFTGAAHLGLDFSWSAGGGLRVKFDRITEFLTARDLATTFISEGSAALAGRLIYMQYLAPIWLLLFGGSQLFLIRRVWRADKKRRPLVLLLTLWCVLPLGFTVVAYSSYTIIYYLPLLPAPCIALALLWKRFTEKFPAIRIILTAVIIVLCALNLNAVWSVDRHINQGIRNLDASTHAFTLDSWVYPPPLIWQVEVSREMRAILEAGEAAELIIIQFTLPHDSHYHLRWPFPYYLRGYDVRTVNIHDPHLIYPERTALYLRNEREVSHNGGYSEGLEFLKQIGPYVLYRSPGGSGPESHYLLAEQPEYANGLRLIGYDELGCDGNWQLHWAPPGKPGAVGEHVHFFIHLQDDAGEVLAQRDLRAYNARAWRPSDHTETGSKDAWDFRADDHVVTSIDFGQVLNGMRIETIRVGLYTYSDVTLTVGEGIYALDEQGRPWEYAVDIPFEGTCSP